MDIDKISLATHVGGSPVKRKTPILRTETTLTLIEAFCGCYQKIALVYQEPCPFVKERLKRENKPGETTMCPKCAQLIREQGGNACPCEDCKMKEQICTYCNGKQVITSSIKLQVPIPRGICDGQVLIIPKEALTCAGGQQLPGDIHVTCKIEKSSIDGFRLQNSNLFVTTKINLLDALTRQPFSIKHLDGRTLDFDSSEEILQPGQVFKVNGEGWPGTGSKPSGDLYIDFDVIFPDSICNNDEELKQLKEMFGIEDMECETPNSEMETVYMEEVDVWSENPELAQKYFGPRPTHSK